MTNDERMRGLLRSLRAFQENAQQVGPAAAASYSLIGAILLLGGVGYGVDAWQGTAPTFLLAGLLLGVITGFYLLAKATWRR